MRLLKLLVLSAIMTAMCLVAPAAAAPVGDGSVLVLPFTVPPGSAQSWIGKGMQEDLQTDLVRGTTVGISAPADTAAATDSGAALAIARQVGASFVVFGQVQYNGTEVRLTGQVLDVTAEKPLGSMKATGPLIDLFHLEDAIVGQTLAALPRSMLRPDAAAAMSPQAAETAPQAANESPANAPGVTNTAPAVVPTYDNSDYFTPQNADLTDTLAIPFYSYSPDYGCALPAYTYSYPPCNLYPYCGVVGTGYVGGIYREGRSGERGRETGALDRGRAGVGSLQNGRYVVGSNLGNLGERNLGQLNLGQRNLGERNLGLNSSGLRSGVNRAGSIRSSPAVETARSFSGSFRAATAPRGASGGFHVGGGGGGGHIGGGGGGHGGGGRR